MKKFRHFAALFAALALCMMAVVPVSAANYTPINGTTCTLYKQLVIPAGSSVPEVDFTFTVTAGGAVAPTATTVQVWAGPNPESVKVNGAAQTGTVSFTAGQALVTGENYAQENIVLDFTAVSFAEPGVYRYIVTENASTNPAITNDTIPTHTVDIYVQDNNGTLEIAQYVVYRDTITTGPNADGTHTAVKNACYVNTYADSGLTVTKSVTGNQGSKDQYFKFTITLTNAGAGTIMTMDKTNMEVTTHANDATSYTTEVMDAANGRDDDPRTDGYQLIADGRGEATVEVYLHHGQSINISGMPIGTEYTVVENDANQYGYTTTYDANATGTIASTPASTTVVNHRAGTVPTGVIATLGVGATIAGLAVTGLIVTNRKKSED